MDDTDRLLQLVAIATKLRTAQRDYCAGGRTTRAECGRLEEAVDRWLAEQCLTGGQRLLAGPDNLVHTITPHGGSHET